MQLVYLKKLLLKSANALVVSTFQQLPSDFPASLMI